MNNSLPNKRKRTEILKTEILKVPDKDRFIKANGFNNENFTIDTVGVEPVKSMRITPITDTTSLYSTGNIETNNEVLSHEIRGDYSPAVGSTPNYGKDTYHRNMFDDGSSYIPPSYTPLSATERSDLLNNMPLKRKHGAGKTKKKNNKKSKKNKSKRKKIMRKIHSKKQRGGGKTRKNKKSKRKTRK